MIKFICSALLLFPTLTYAKRVRTLRLKSNVVSTIAISHRGAVLNFPTKPSKVVMGTGNQFAIEYIGNDLAISPLSSVSRAHVFVYLDGRRFNLDLVASSAGHTLVQIRDSIGSQVEVPYVRD